VIASPDELPVIRAAEIETESPEAVWLIHDLWTRSAVGVIGGAPKCCKSWFGLDMATSVASGTPCLGHFQVQEVGPALIYLAEDALPAVRTRLENLCLHRGIELRDLDVHVISAPTLRLDLERDQRRLAATIERLQPKLLLLDPLVRLHRLDENSASEISGLLGFLRGLQRAYDLAVALCHHASKKRRAQPGQSLRGSSDIHAWTDSSAYLSRRQDQLHLTVEHRAAAAPDPMVLRLASSESHRGVYLELVGAAPASPVRGDLNTCVLGLLRQRSCPLTRAALRAALCVNNHRLGVALTSLEQHGAIRRTSRGWVAAASAPG